MGNQRTKINLKKMRTAITNQGDMVMDGRILIVGGYGGVGRVISTARGDRFPGQVVVAGSKGGEIC
jgi:S-adenosylhomocysteine hydrolase